MFNFLNKKQMPENRIEIIFSNSDWKSGFLKKGVCFNEPGHDFKELEDDGDIEIISEQEYYGGAKVVLDVKKWIGSILSDVKGVLEIYVEGKSFKKGAGRFVLDDIDYGFKDETSLYEYLK